MLRTLLISAALLFSLSAPANAKSLTIDLASPEVLELNGAVSWESVEPLVDSILELAGTVPQITIIINSPGGEVYSGLHLINVMNIAKHRGTNFRCISTFLAASMAYQILASCDTRIALQGTLLLWHPVRVSIGGGIFTPPTIMTPRAAAELSNDLNRLEHLLVSELRAAMPMDPNTFFRHYHAETLWLARELAQAMPNWIAIVDDVVGIQTLDMSKSNKPAPVAPGGQFIYIWSGTGVAKK